MTWKPSVLHTEYMSHVVIDHGIPFCTRRVDKGMNYGLDMCLTHNEDDPLIEFYDHRYQHTPPFGQFISRYYLSTLLERQPIYGLNLEGGVPDWHVSTKTLNEVLARWS